MNREDMDKESRISQKITSRDALMVILNRLEFNSAEKMEWLKLFDESHRKKMESTGRYLKSEKGKLAVKRSKERRYKKLHPNYVPGLRNGKVPWTYGKGNNRYCVTCEQSIECRPKTCSSPDHKKYYLFRLRYHKKRRDERKKK